MILQQFLKVIAQQPGSNFFVTAPTNLGLTMMIQGALSGVANKEDVYFHAAETLTKEKVLQLEREARLAPRGSSKHSHFYVYGCEVLPRSSIGPLLKVVEEARFARFIFQAQGEQGFLGTIKSRCSEVSLPFLSKRVVMGNLKALNYDTLAVERLGLYDGTIEGTVKALATKDTTMEIRRELERGARGAAVLLDDEVVQSPALVGILREKATREERSFLARGDTESRRRLVLFLASRRAG